MVKEQEGSQVVSKRGHEPKTVEKHCTRTRG